MAQPPYAEAACVLNVQSNCPACKMHTLEVLGSVVGLYDIDINAEEGLARVQGVVEPNLFLKALARTGTHAGPKWVKIKHPKMNRGPGYYQDPYSNYGSLGYNHGGGGAIGYNPYNPNYSGGYNHGGAVFADPYQQQHYPPMEPYYPPYHGSNPYYPGSGLPPSCRRRGPFQL